MRLIFNRKLMVVFLIFSVLFSMGCQGEPSDSDDKSDSGKGEGGNAVVQQDDTPAAVEKLISHRR